MIVSQTPAVPLANPPAPAVPPTPAPPAPAQPDLLDEIVRVKQNPNSLECQDLRNKFQAALQAQLQDTIGGMVQGWRTPHVEKPAFPFQVEKQGRIWGPQASAQAAANMSAVVGTLTNPQIASMILLDLEGKLFPQAPSAPREISDPTFRTFYDDVRHAAAHSGNFVISGTLVNVGWGNGDHVNVSSSHIPCGPNGTSTHLSYEITQSLFAPSKP